MNVTNRLSELFNDFLAHKKKLHGRYLQASEQIFLVKWSKKIRVTGMNQCPNHYDPVGETYCGSS